jgi:hypothetical protein
VPAACSFDAFVRDRPGPVSQPAPAGLGVSGRLSVSVSPPEPTTAGALSFALGGGLHAGIAVTDAEAFLHAVAVCLAVTPGNVAAVGSD